MTVFSWKHPAKGLCGGMDVVTGIRFVRLATLDDGRVLEHSMAHVPGGADIEQPREYWTQAKLDEIAAFLEPIADENLNAEISLLLAKG